MRIEFLTATFVVAAAPAFAQPVTPAPGYCGPMWNEWGWMMMGPLPMVVILVALVALIVLAVRWFPQNVSRTSALDILNERYARGEIDKTEFEQKKQDLKR